jgi:uncharacterized damage-inducible protein DinB
MRVTDLRELFDDNDWANACRMRAADNLTAEQFVAPARFPGGSLRGCLLHVVNALRFHLAGWQGRPAPTDRKAGDCPDVGMLRALWAGEDAALRSFLATLTDADLDQPRSLTFTREGILATAPRWKMMVHHVNHGTQHRSDAAQMLTDRGHSPGDLDLSAAFPTRRITGCAACPPDES